MLILNEAGPLADRANAMCFEECRLVIEKLLVAGEKVAYQKFRRGDLWILDLPQTFDNNNLRAFLSANRINADKMDLDDDEDFYSPEEAVPETKTESEEIPAAEVKTETAADKDLEEGEEEEEEGEEIDGGEDEDDDSVGY